jgi:hypothetical protein
MEQLVVSFIQCPCNQVHRLDGDRSRENTAYQQPFAWCHQQPFCNMCCKPRTIHASELCICFVFFSKEGLKLWIHALLPDYEFAEAGIF